MLSGFTGLYENDGIQIQDYRIVLQQMQIGLHASLLKVVKTTSSSGFVKKMVGCFQCFEYCTLDHPRMRRSLMKPIKLDGP